VDALVIGGTRNLGPSIVESLLAAGYRVAVFNRGVTPDDLPPEVRRLRGDRSDAGELSRALAGGDFDLVVDTTLYDGPDADAVSELLRDRVGRYVFLSTGQVYLVREGLARPFREEDYEGPVMPAPPPEHTLDRDNWSYGAGKRAAEDSLMRAHRDEDFPVYVLRLPMVNSERDHYQRVYNYIVRLRDGGPILVPPGAHLPLSHVYGEDVVRAISAVATGEGVAGQAYNISQDDTLAFDGFLALLSGLCGGTPRTVAVPLERLHAEGLVPDSSPFSEPWMSALDNGRSRRELGMRYTPYAEYLPRLVAYFDSRAGWTLPGYARRSRELGLAREYGRH
jgi:nucleoside-diphosphate-sugar epimerase